MFAKRIALPVLALLLAVPAFAAQGTKGDWEIGLYTGYAMLDDYGTSVTSLHPEDDILVGARLGYFFTATWELELSYQKLFTMTQFDPVLNQPNTDFDVDSLRLNMLLNFNRGKSFRPYLSFGGGQESVEVGNFDDDFDSFNVGGGLRWFVSPHFGVRLDAKFVSANVEIPGVTNRWQDNFEASYGFLWAFGGKSPRDTDGDGVPDGKDDCPGTPAGALVDKHGCPIDSDGDGVPDGIDQCPDTPRGWPVDNRGCPLDSDGDNVPDGRDRCPNTPRGAVVDQDGCPIDSDGDGVPDGVDQCPSTPQGARVDARGCPTDSDGDGVPDGIDRCPNTPRGARVDPQGCPIDSDGDGVPDGIDQCPDTPRGIRVDTKGCQLLFEEGRELVLEGVTFKFDSAELTPNARTILDRVAQSLVQWPEIRVEVGGHTDSKGNDAYNMDLSKRRAESVREYLSGKGVSASRLTAKGYGETDPIADNGTEEGRQKNRRVELTRLD